MVSERPGKEVGLTCELPLRGLPQFRFRLRNQNPEPGDVAQFVYYGNAFSCRLFGDACLHKAATV